LDDAYPYCSPFLQYSLFTQNGAVKTLQALGIRANPFFITTGAGLPGLGPTPTLLVGLYSAAALRQAYWVLVREKGEIKPDFALQVVIYNLVNDTLCTLAAAAALTPELPLATLPKLVDNGFLGWVESLGTFQLIGAALFVVGLGMEILCEEQRAAFKKKKENKGKVCDIGLWSVVRHPNYLGYTLWRTGMMLSSVSTLRILSQFSFVC
jgi:hypothetical protein